jgi:hypothetical protein
MKGHHFWGGKVGPSSQVEAKNGCVTLAVWILTNNSLVIYIYVFLSATNLDNKQK